MAKKQKISIDELIEKAVLATRLSCARESQDAFKATEKRLYAYPVLKAKKQDNEEMLEEVKLYGAHGRSKSVSRFVRSGTRLDPEEIKQAVIMDLKAAIASDQYEIGRIEKAIEQISGDEYRDIVIYKYFEQKSDDEIAKRLHCAPRTVRTHKSRLVTRLAVFLYGSGALA